MGIFSPKEREEEKTTNGQNVDVCAVFRGVREELGRRGRGEREEEEGESGREGSRLCFWPSCSLVVPVSLRAHAPLAAKHPTQDRGNGNAQTRILFSLMAHSRNY